MFGLSSIIILEVDLIILQNKLKLINYFQKYEIITLLILTFDNFYPILILPSTAIF